MTWKFWTWFKKKPIETSIKEETKTGFIAPPPPKNINPISSEANKEKCKAVPNSAVTESENKTTVIHEDNGISVLDLYMLSIATNGMHSDCQRDAAEGGNYNGGSCGGGGSSRNWNNDDDDTKKFGYYGGYGSSVSCFSSDDSSSSSCDSGSSCDCSSCD